MTETLIVTYLPSGESSQTKRLLDSLIENISGRYHVIDLLQQTPFFLTPDRMRALIKRNYLGETLNSSEKAMVSRSDDYIRHLRQTKHLVLAYPMHNFSMPAIIKAFFDSVIIKGETFDVSDHQYTGLMKDKNGLALTTSGGCYDEKSGWNDYEHCFSLQEKIFDFLGYENNKVISVQGCDELPKEDIERRFKEAIEHLQKHVCNW